jgi:hypothetical protein
MLESEFCIGFVYRGAAVGTGASGRGRNECRGDAPEVRGPAANHSVKYTEASDTEATHSESSTHSGVHLIPTIPP